MLYVDTFGAFGGVGRCSVELLPFLARRMGEVIVAGRSHIVDSYRPSLPAEKKLRLWNLEQPRFHPGAWALRALARARPLSPAYTHALLHRAGVRAKNRGPVLINYPQGMAPPEGSYEFNIFIHDLNWRRFPDGFLDPQSLDDRCRGWVKQARRIFTNSDFTRQEVIELYGVEPGRVIAAPLAPPSVPPPLAAGLETEKLKALGLQPDGYFFYPSVLGSHKGHDALADALADGISSILPVVITAPIQTEGLKSSTPAERFQNTVVHKLDHLRREGKIISLPYLPWNEVLLVAGSCRAYVLPSRFEGFGFPLAEAMALGKFSICSEIPAFREILNRYGAKIRAATFPSGDAKALRELLRAKSSPNETPDEADGRRPDLSSSWGWADTANAIADGL